MLLRIVWQRPRYPPLSPAEDSQRQRQARLPANGPVLRELLANHRPGALQLLALYRLRPAAQNDGLELAPVVVILVDQHRDARVRPEPLRADPTTGEVNVHRRLAVVCRTHRYDVRLTARSDGGEAADPRASHELLRSEERRVGKECRSR